jgi:hypothetical protein
MILISEGCNTALASVPVNSSGDVRNYVGFSNMHYALLNGPKRLTAGHTSFSQDQPYQWETVIVSAGNIDSGSNFYPNPTRGIFYYNIESGAVPGQMTIFDALGRPVVAVMEVGRNGAVDLSPLPDGVYFVRFTNDGKSDIRKIVVRH